MDPSQPPSESHEQQTSTQHTSQGPTQTQDQQPPTQPSEQPQLLTDKQITARCNVLIEDIEMQIFIMNEAAEVFSGSEAEDANDIISKSLAHYKAVHSEFHGMINSIQDHLAVLAEIDPTPYEEIEHFMSQAYLFDKVVAKLRE